MPSMMINRSARTPRLLPEPTNMWRETRGHARLQGQFVGDNAGTEILRGDEGEVAFVRADVPANEKNLSVLVIRCEMSPFPSAKSHHRTERDPARQRWLNLHNYRQEHLSPLLHHHILCFICVVFSHLLVKLIER